MHDLVVGLALGVKVGAALAAAHGKGGQAVLEDLLQTQELEHTQGDRRVKAQAALVGSNGRVELDAVTAVDLNLALIVDPGNTEHDDALGLDEALQQGGLLVLGVGVERRLDGAEDLGRGLDELRLLGIAGLELFENFLRVAHASSNDGKRKCRSRHPMRRELYRVWIISHCCSKVSHKPTSRCFVLITMQVEAFLSTRRTNRVFRSCFVHMFQTTTLGTHDVPGHTGGKTDDTADPHKNKTAPLRHAARPRSQKRWWRVAGTYVNRTHPRRFARLATVLRTAEPTGAHPFPSAAVFYQTEQPV